MGIKNLSKLIKKYSEYRMIPLSRFSNKTIAIDSGTFLIRNWSAAYSDVTRSTLLAFENIDRFRVMNIFLSIIKRFFGRMHNLGIKLIFVLEGNAPVYKSATQQNRRRVKEEAAIKYNEIKEDINSKYNNYELDTIDMDQEELRKLANRCSEITNAEYQQIIREIQALGVNCVQAVGEAEKLCSMLSIERKVEAVYSNDTDNLVYGCPLLLTEISGDEFKSIDLNKLLNDLKLSYTEFVDLCIMMGCDYNTNIPKVGPIKSYNYIKKYHRIECIPLDTSCLNYQVCRDIFKYQSSAELIVTNPHGLRQGYGSGILGEGQQGVSLS